MGHFSRVCKKKSSTSSGSASGLNVSYVELNEMSCLFIGEVSSLDLPVKV